VQWLVSFLRWFLLQSAVREALPMSSEDIILIQQRDMDTENGLTQSKYTRLQQLP
jgi:hypothetical protein